MTKTVEPLDEMEALKALLTRVQLPMSDLTGAAPQQFFGIRSEGQLVGSVGIETYGTVALLRSLAVLPSHRSQGLACRLVQWAEDYAANEGVTAIYLLTASAENFFLRLGYAQTSRASAPAAIAATAQFSGLCPASSAFLSKSIAGRHTGAT